MRKIRINEHSEDIFSISWSDLSAKTFLFERIAVRTIWYSFERLWLSVPKKECHPFEWLEPSFHKKCHLFERLVLSVRTAWAIRLKKIVIRSKTKLSTVRATEAIFSKINVSQVAIPKQFRRYFASNDLLFSSGHDTLRSLFTNHEYSVTDLCSSLSYYHLIIDSIDIRFIQ